MSGPGALRRAARPPDLRAGLASRRMLRRCLPVVVHRPPRSGVSPARSLVHGRFSRTQGWDRTRPFGRWSYARPGENLAQGNPNSMPQIRPGAKSPAQSRARLAGTLPAARPRAGQRRVRGPGGRLRAGPTGGGSVTRRFRARHAGAAVRALHVQEPVDGRAGAVAVSKSGNVLSRPSTSAGQQGDGAGPVHLPQLGGLRAVEDRVERCRARPAPAPPCGLLHGSHFSGNTNLYRQLQIISAIWGECDVD